MKTSFHLYVLLCLAHYGLDKGVVAGPLKGKFTDHFLTPSLLVSNIKKLQTLVSLPFSGLEQSGEFLLHLPAKFGKELNSPPPKGACPDWFLNQLGAVTSLSGGAWRELWAGITLLSQVAFGHSNRSPHFCRALWKGLSLETCNEALQLLMWLLMLWKCKPLRGTEFEFLLLTAKTKFIKNKI